MVELKFKQANWMCDFYNY